MHLADVSRRRRQPGADGPDRLIGDNKIGRTVGQRALQLRCDHVQRVSGLALRPRFADANDRHQSRTPCHLRLRMHLGVSLMVIPPTFGVADDDRRCAGILQHFGGNVARIGARSQGMTILAADQNRRAACGRGEARDQRRGRTHHQLDLRKAPAPAITAFS